MILPRALRRRAYSLVEVICVIAIVALVASLIIPAIQSAREASHRASCLDHMRQIGMAVQSYQARHGVMPIVNGAENTPWIEGEHMRKMFSVFSGLTLDLDAAPLYHASNFSVELLNPYTIPERNPRQSVRDRGYEANRTVMATTLGVLLCPSDGGSGRLGWTGPASYRANLGTDRWYAIFDLSNGPLSPVPNPVSPAAITDGLSNTVAFSEKLLGRWPTGPFDARRHMLVNPRSESIVLADFVARCEALPDTSGGYGTFAGLSWFVGDLTQTCYNHIRPPHSPLPDCSAPFYHGLNNGIFAARSNHPGGVVAAMADGSTRFVASTISPATWAALGTRNGGEVAGPY